MAFRTFGIRNISFTGIVATGKASLTADEYSIVTDNLDIIPTDFYISLAR